jgi:hypothetical protein
MNHDVQSNIVPQNMVTTSMPTGAIWILASIAVTSLLLIFAVLVFIAWPHG